MRRFHMHLEMLPLQILKLNWNFRLLLYEHGIAFNIIFTAVSYTLLGKLPTSAYFIGLSLINWRDIPISAQAP